MKTAIILPHREQFSEGSAGAIALSLAAQLTEDHLNNIDVELWGDPLMGRSLAPHVVFKPLVFSWWHVGRQSWRYMKAILRVLKEETSPVRLEIHNRAILFKQLAHFGMPLALYLHNDPITIRGLETVLERIIMLNKADYVVCVSDFLRNRLCNGVPLSLCKKVFVIPNTLDFSYFDVKTTKKKEIIFVGRLIHDKGAIPLLHALQAVLPKFPEWSARLIGAQYFGQNKPQSPYELELLKIANQALPGRIHFDGYQPYSVVAEAFNRSAVAVVPSLWDEPFGRTALEGMAAGCAVIASNRGGLADVVGSAGVLVEPTESDIASALIKLMSNNVYCNRVGSDCAERARSVFGSANISSEINRVRGS